MIGKVIQGRYHLEKLLGEGGFGAVYQAKDIKLERLVAIKLLNQGAKSNSDHAQRFITEAKVTSQLSHRNIPVVYEYGESEEGQLFIVTELFQGLSLEDVIDTIHLSPRQASWIANEVNEALIVAHKRGITHRDVKPPNIYIHQGTSGEEVKLLDFGIAKLNNNQSHTLTGQLFGTPYFMAPEQILGQKNISPATDMYSLGAVLFYCLTRTVPYDGDSQFMIFNKHVNSPTPLLVERHPLLTQNRLQELINFLMEKKPEDRPKSSHEAREIFAEIEYLCTQIDPNPHLNPLALAQAQQHTQISKPNPFSAELLPHIETPISEQLQVPPPLAITQGLYNTPIDPLDEIITLPPLDDHWRPTAQLHINDIMDPLADDDDTTDNISTATAHKTELDLKAIHLDTPIYGSEQVTQITATPLDPMDPNPSEGATPEEIARFKHGLEDTTGAIDLPNDNRKGISTAFAVLIFIGGLWFSLSLFGEDVATSKVDQTELKNSAGTTNVDVNSNNKVSNEPSLPLPIRDSNQNLETQTTNKLGSGEKDVLTIDEPILALPRAEIKKSKLSKRSPQAKKTKTKNLSHKRHSASKKRTQQSKKRPLRSKQKQNKTYNKARYKPSQSKQGALAQKTTSGSSSSKLQNIKSIQLRVSPRKASYLTGDKIRVTSKILSVNGELKDHPLNYILKPLKGGKDLISSRPYLTLKQGSWSLKACSRKQAVCSSNIKLIVYDPSALINLDD